MTRAPCSCSADQCQSFGQDGCQMVSPVFEIFDFSALPRPRSSYERTLENYRSGLISLGFLWALGDLDEVFRAWLVKKGIERL